MNFKMEKRFLEELLKCISAQDKVLKKLKIMRYSLLFGPLLIIAIFYGVFNVKNENIDFLFAYLCGVSIGLSILYSCACRQTPIFTKYLDKEKIEKRLEELKSQP